MKKRFEIQSGLPLIKGRRGNIALVFGIVGLIGGLLFFFCPLISLPFMVMCALAWSFGVSELRMYKALGAVGNEEKQAKAGYVLGIIGTLVVSVSMIFLGVYSFVLIWESFDINNAGFRLITEF
jgi:hypothetical protein